MLRTIGAYLLPPLLAIITAIAAGKLELFPPGSVYNLLAVAIATTVGGWLALRLHPNGVNGPPRPTTPAPPRSSGFVSLRLLLVVLVLLLAGTARAQTARLGSADLGTAPPFGGCNASGSICAGPSVAAAIAAIDLKSGDVLTGIMPGVGYQLTFMADRWHSLGVGAYVNVQTGSDLVPRTGLTSVILSFAQYVRVGLGWQLFQHRAFGLLGLGLDFGP